MYNARDKVTSAKCCSLYQKPEHIDTDNQRARCQKYLRTNYKANYKYIAATCDDSKLNRCVEKSGVFSGVRT